MQSTKELRVHSVFDPAIDLDRSRITKYQLERKPEYLVTIPGVKPATFVIRRIPNAVLTGYVEEAGSEQLRHIRAFEVGVIRVEDLVTREGQFLPIYETPVVMAAGRQTHAIPPEHLEYFHPDDIYDVGAAAYGYAFLRHGSGLFFPLPPSSQSALERRAGSFLPAVTTPPADRSSDERKEPPTPASASSSASPGAATATG